MMIGPMLQMFGIILAATVGPGQKIQGALDAAQPGSTVVVQPGVYDEVVTLRVSGTQAAPITLEARQPQSVTIRQLTISADWVRASGFKIIPTSENTAIFFDRKFNGALGPRHSAVIGCYVEGAQMGIQVYGEDNAVETLEVNGLTRWGKGDMDFARFWGARNTFRGCAFHGEIKGRVDPTTGTPAHVDGWQTFPTTIGGRRLHSEGIVIEDCSVQGGNEGLMLEGESAAPNSITVRNCIFQDQTGWGIDAKSYTAVALENTLFYNMKTHGTGAKGPGTSITAKNCIYANVGGTALFAIKGGTIAGSTNNDFWRTRNRGGAKAMVADPLFLNPPASFVLSPKSRLIGAGVEGVTLGPRSIWPATPTPTPTPTPKPTDP